MMTENESQPATPGLWKYVHLALWISLALAVIYQIEMSLLAVSPFDAVPIDGPFQLNNWLRRLDAGQVPGRDFYCFHGIGIPYIHYPIYRFLGGDLFAMELSRQLLSRLATISVYLLVSRMCTKRFTLGILWSLTTMLPYMELAGSPLSRYILTNVIAAYDPQVSMYGLRSLLPLIFIATFFFSHSWRLVLLQTAILGASIFVSIENGTALLLGTAISGVLFLSLAYFQPKFLQPGMRLIVLATLSTVGIALGLTTVIGAGNIPDYLIFHFRNQMQDQTWFFGGPPTQYLLDGKSATLIMLIYLLFLVFAACAWIGWLCKKVPQATEENTADVESRIAQGSIVGLFYAMISMSSMLGYMNVTALASFNRMVYMLGSIHLYRKYAPRLRYPQHSLLPRILLGTIVLLVTLQVLWCVRIGARFTGIRFSERCLEHLKVCEPVFSASKTVSQPNLLWSEYAASLESELNILPPSRWDYIIHALGSDRQKYCEEFARLKPLYVLTSRQDLNTFGEWLRFSIFPFYKTLLFNYRIVAETPFNLIWRRVDEKPQAHIEDSLELQPIGPLQYEVPAAFVGKEKCMILVELDYETKNSIRGLPLIGNCARYTIQLTGSLMHSDVSLSPFLRVVEFPVIPDPGHSFRLDFKINGIRWNAEIDVKRVKVSRLVIDSSND